MKECQKFTGILYLTLGALPCDYINEMRKQYPENDICVLIPMFKIDDAKPIMRFDYFSQNRTVEAAVYKFPKNGDNIQVYGLFHLHLLLVKTFLILQNYITLRHL